MDTKTRAIRTTMFPKSFRPVSLSEADLVGLRPALHWQEFYGLYNSQSERAL
jgi:hypothetical protein